MNFQTTFSRLTRLKYNLSCKLPLIQSQEFLAGYENLNPNVPVVSTHWETASLFDHLFIASIVRALRPQTSFEIGTSIGLVTTTLARNSPPQARIHTLDMSSEQHIGSYFRDLPEAARIERHTCSSKAFDFERVGKVDFFFIDGSHDFEDVQSDTRNALRMLSTRGVIVWHDVNSYFPEVSKALEQSAIAPGQIRRIYGTACAVYAAPRAPFPLKEHKEASHEQLQSAVV